MEFDEINALINLERERYHHDLINGNIYKISHKIKEDKDKIIAEKAEQAALRRAKMCAYEVELAMVRFNIAMNEHMSCMKRVMTL